MAEKPVIIYQAGPDSPITHNVSIVQKRTEDSSVNWANKAELVAYVDQLYVPPTSDTYLYIQCTCGRNYDYATSGDVPVSNTNWIGHRLPPVGR